MTKTVCLALTGASGMPYGLRLLEWVEGEALRRGATELALDTAEGAAHLRRWYGARGYRLVAHAQWGVTNYRSVILSRALGNGAPDAGAAA